MPLIDIDRFKDINDGYGHQAGDEVAVEIARRIGAVLRPADICGRWGGDEFIVLFSDLGSRPLKPIAEAIKRVQSGRAQGRAQRAGRGQHRRLPRRTGRDGRAGGRHADAALYTAKEEGRDRVVVYDPTKTRSSAGGIAG
jgi:diguanylate cyclase (GGDEF)-like protein